MKKRLSYLFLCAVLVIGLASCGGSETSVEKDISGGQNDYIEQKEADVKSDTGSSSQASSTEAPASGETEAQPAYSSMFDNASDFTWTPEEFAQNDNVTIDFIAPSVHSGKEECSFLWNYTEEDMKEWFAASFGDYTGSIYESFRNESNEHSAGVRTYAISRENKGAEYTEDARLSVMTGVYNANVVSSVSFDMKNPNLDFIVGKMTELLEMMGFGDYADELLHATNLSGVKIPTENGLGEYSVRVSYFTSEVSPVYSLYLTIQYEDTNYREDGFDGYTAANYERWDDYYSLGDFLKNSTLDTSGLDAFEKDVLDTTLTIFGEGPEVVRTLEELFTYSRTDSGEIRNPEFKYILRRRDDQDTLRSGTISMHFTQDSIEKDADFDVSIYGRKYYSDRDDDRWSLDGDDLSDAEIRELCEGRYELLKKLDSSVNWTIEDLIAKYRNREFDEDCDVERFEGDGYSLSLFNTLDDLGVYGNFKPKTDINN